MSLELSLTPFPLETQTQLFTSLANSMNHLSDQLLMSQSGGSQSGLWTSSISTTWECIRNANSCIPLSESETLGMGPATYV